MWSIVLLYICSFAFAETDYVHLYCWIGKFRYSGRGVYQLSGARGRRYFISAYARDTFIVLCYIFN